MSSSGARRSRANCLCPVIFPVLQDQLVVGDLHMPSPRRIIANARYALRNARRPKWVRAHGVKLPTDPDLLPREVIELIFRNRYERQEAELARAELSSDDRVLEIGAGIGFMGTIAARICGSDNVLTYEANPNLEPIIRYTHALNSVAPTLRMRAVAPSKGEVTFYRNDNIVSSSLIDREFGGGMTVEADAMSDILAGFRPTTIIADIEGAEITVFRNVDLSDVGKILIELHPKIVGETANGELLQSLYAQGFSLAAGTPKKVALLKRDAA